MHRRGEAHQRQDRPLPEHGGALPAGHNRAGRDGVDHKPDRKQRQHHPEHRNGGPPCPAEDQRDHRIGESARERKARRGNRRQQAGDLTEQRKTVPSAPRRQPPNKHLPERSGNDADRRCENPLDQRILSEDRRRIKGRNQEIPGVIDQGVRQRARRGVGRVGPVRERDP